jgi:hypothetical protein
MVLIEVLSTNSQRPDAGIEPSRFRDRKSTPWNSLTPVFGCVLHDYKHLVDLRP